MLAGAGALVALGLAAMTVLALALRATGADPGPVPPIADPVAWAVFTA